MTIRQLPGFAFRSAADYADRDGRHPRPLRPGVRRRRSSTRSSGSSSSTSSRSTWFTRRARRPRRLDRRLHARPDAAAVAAVGARSGSSSRTPFYDPELPDRAAMTGPIAGGRSRASCGGIGSGVREAETDGRPLPLRRPPPLDEAGDAAHPPGPDPVPRRGGGHVASSATSSGCSSSEGDSLTVQPIGTPGLLLVKNYGSRRPGFLETGQADATSRPTSASTRTARRSPARRSGSTTRSRSTATRFHENGFGPAPELLDQRRGRQAAVGRPGAR